MSTRGVTNPSHLQAPAGPGAERRMAGRAPIQLIMGARLPLISTEPLPLIGGARPPPNLFPAIGGAVFPLGAGARVKLVSGARFPLISGTSAPTN